MTIDDTLAGGLMNRYIRELGDSAERLRSIVLRENVGQGKPWEATVRRLDAILDRYFAGYIVSKVVVLDKKRSYVEALVLLPVGAKNIKAGSFMMSSFKASRGGVSLHPLSLRASFHWTRRVFQRRGVYDPALVCQEVRAALVGLSALGVTDSGYFEVPSVEGVSAVSINTNGVETITYMTDRQASEEQSRRWSEARGRIVEALGMTCWSDIVGLVKRPCWVAKPEKGVMTLRPKEPWRLSNGDPVILEDHPMDGMFIGICRTDGAMSSVKLAA